MNCSNQFRIIRGSIDDDNLQDLHLGYNAKREDYVNVRCFNDASVKSSLVVIEVLLIRSMVVESIDT